MNENDDERWITERFRAGDGFREIASAAIARGYERGKAEGADSARGWTDALDAELTRVRNALTRFGVPDTAGEVPHHRAIQPAERVDMLGDDRDRLAKRCEYLDDVIGAMQNADVRDTDRLAALEQRVGELVEITRGCVDESIEEQDALARLAALRSPAPEVDGLRAQVADLTRERDAYRKAKAENDERFMIERDTARRERDEALGVVRRYLDWDPMWGDLPKGTLRGIKLDMRALVAGQPVVDPRDAEIAELQAKLAARSRHIDANDRAHDAMTKAGLGCTDLDVAGRVEALIAQRDALRAHAEKLDGLCERVGCCPLDILVMDVADALGEVPR